MMNSMHKGYKLDYRLRLESVEAGTLSLKLLKRVLVSSELSQKQRILFRLSQKAFDGQLRFLD